MSENGREVYYLETRITGVDPEKIQVKNEIIIGSDKSAQVCYEDLELSPFHCRFRQTNEVLTITNLGGSGKTKIGKQKLEQGKMYILEKGDRIEIGNMGLVVMSEIVEEKESEFKNFPFPKHGEESFESKTSTQFKNLDNSDDEKEDQGTQKNLNNILPHILNSKKEKQSEAEDSDYSHDEDEDEDESSRADLIFTQKIIKLFKGHPKGGLPNRPERKAAPTIKGHKATAIPRHKFPGIFSRVYSIFITLIFAIGIDQHILPLLSLDNKISDWFKLLKPYINIVVKLIPTQYQHYTNGIFSEITFKFMLIYLTLALIGAIIFGTPIPLALMGVSGESNFFINRLKAVLRFILGLILTPFIIFELPILIGKRPLKEFLSGIYYSHGPILVRLFSIMIFLPFISLLTFTFPIFPILQDIMDPISTDITKVKSEKVSQKELQYFSNKTLNLSLANVDNGKSIYIPYFDLKNKSFAPAIKIIYTIDGKAPLTGVTLFKERDIELKTFFEQLPKKDPLLNDFSHHLAFYLKKGRKEKSSHSEVQNIIKNSLSLNITNLHHFVTSHGIFFTPYIDLRNNILDHLNLSRISSLEEMKTKGPIFFILNSETHSKRSRHYYLYLQDQTLKSFSIQFTDKSQRLMHKFKRISLLNSKEYKVKTSISERTMYNAFDLMDVFNLIHKNKKKLTPEIIQSCTDFYMKLALNIISFHQNFEEIKIDFLKSLRITDKNLINIQKKKKNFIIENFRLNLNRIQKAVEDNDQSFFQENLNRE